MQMIKAGGFALRSLTAADIDQILQRPEGERMEYQVRLTLRMVNNAPWEPTDRFTDPLPEIPLDVWSALVTHQTEITAIDDDEAAAALSGAEDVPGGLAVTFEGELYVLARPTANEFLAVMRRAASATMDLVFYRMGRNIVREINGQPVARNAVLTPRQRAFLQRAVAYMGNGHQGNGVVVEIEEV